MAPELIGTGITYNPASDLYALGCVAYYLLTAHNVFEANSAMSMAVAHATEPPKPPSSRGIELPEALDALILKCLAKRPGERPESACSLSRELAKVPLARQWDNDRAQEWWNGHLPDQAYFDSAKTFISEAPTAIVEPMLSA